MQGAVKEKPAAAVPKPDESIKGRIIIVVLKNKRPLFTIEETGGVFNGADIALVRTQLIVAYKQFKANQARQGGR